jgi:VWFA-related protein
MMRALLLGLLLLGQTVPGQQPTFRTRVDSVLVDVIVTDRNDRPVTDLTAADFEIVDRGRLQRITDFQFVSIPVSTAPLEADTPKERAEAALADVATNAPPTPASRLFVLVIDDLHIIESEIVAVKNIITDFVTGLSPHDEVGVVFTGRSDLGINITRDRARLIAAIDRVREALGFGLDALHRLPGAGDPVIDEKRKLSNLPVAYARATAISMRNVVDAVAASPHPRRAIVLVSAGVAINPNASQEAEEFQWWRAIHGDLVSALGSARQANVPIYTLDPRGHTMPEDAVRGGIGAIGGLNMEVGVGSKAPTQAGPGGERIRAEIAHRIRLQQNYLSTIAINTGGRAFINQSNLKRAVGEIVAENGSYYLLAFSPEPLERDGKFHEIDIRVKRSGVRVRGRDGYLSVSDKPAPEEPGEKLRAAIASPINVSGIGLRGVATPISPGAKGTLTAVTLEVTYPMLPGSTAPIDDVLHVNLTGLDPDAKVKATAAHAFAFRAQSIDADYVTFLVNAVIELPPQPLTLRMGLASRALGRVGMVQIPVHARLDAPLQISGIALGVDGTPAPALGGEVIQRLVPFQPTTRRAFLAEDTLRIYMRMFWTTNDNNVELTFSVTGPKAIAARAVPLAAAAAADGNRRQATFETTLPLRGLPPGDYVLHVEARLPNRQTARKAVPFQLISR